MTVWQAPKTFIECFQWGRYHRTRVAGQNLIRDMIPKVCHICSMKMVSGHFTFILMPCFPKCIIDNGTTSAYKTHQLDKGSSAAFIDGNDPYTAAAIRVGSFLVGAGAITWYGVPLVVFVIRLVLPE
jgi:hypothetical protein